MHGWLGIERRLNEDLAKISPRLHAVASENSYGLPLFALEHPDHDEMDNVQWERAVKMADRAEKIAHETCIRCGNYGKISYQDGVPHSKVLCDKHRPEDWRILG